MWNPPISRLLNNPEIGELTVREIDVSGIHIPRLDIDGRVIPHDPEIDGPQHQGPLIDNTGSELPGHPERHVEASRRNNAPVQINGQRFAIRLEPETDGAQNRNDAAPDNRAGPAQAEPGGLARKWLRFRHFVINELPTWPLDGQFPVYATITFIYILLCELIMFMVVILSVGALNIMLQMESGPRAVSQQILKDIPFAYLRHMTILFSCSVVVDGFTVFHLGPPEEHGLRLFPMLYLHRQSARLCVPVANRLLDLYTVISVVNCALLGYRLLSAN
ncbi:hypothetical protein LMH87_001816 [Akanthomyces muscarius]|uniref:Uncharacterized protein n=1 Tax=Akanthomyces muscarius TaxID=2231603 RepID=A0A9W8Q5W5_AKAMU|nr:hypothetical protein LMH87_001816 [Akanthomyces muscarius]KAJ4147282.1 hypothetical protein LMH87_001816 [Akanthomyces muscarius]